jgi:hypothetical protein
VEVRKVKKRAVVTGVRNVLASKRRAARPAAKGRVASKAKRAKTKQSARKTIKKKVAAKRPAIVPVATFRVKPLEPHEKCGAGTSVQLLFRVEELLAGRSTKHLVFLDRHGWYCEHGRNCPAVGHAKKHKGRIARAS